MKKVIYTAIFGNKDTLKDPLYRQPDCDYVCFTDNQEVKSSVWDIVLVEKKFEDPVRCARYYKVLPHLHLQKYSISLWVDANFLICSPLEEYFAILGEQANILGFQHDQGRNCIYDEAEAVIRINKDDPDIVREQMKKYTLEGFPKSFGLSTTAVLLRRHNESDVMEFCNLWWEEIRNHSRRDQLSFFYCKWKCNTKMYMLKYPNYDIRYNKWFRWTPHNYETQPWSF